VLEAITSARQRFSCFYIVFVNLHVLNTFATVEVDVLVAVTPLKNESAYSVHNNFDLYRSSVPTLLLFDFVIFDSSCLYTILMGFSVLHTNYTPVSSKPCALSYSTSISE
jgi:hypothetical protein